MNPNFRPQPTPDQISITGTDPKSHFGWLMFGLSFAAEHYSYNTIKYNAYIIISTFHEIRINL